MPSSAREGVVWLNMDGHMRRSVYGFEHGNLNATAGMTKEIILVHVIIGLKLIASHSCD